MICHSEGDGQLECNTDPADPYTLVAMCGPAWCIDFDGWDFTELTGVLAMRGNSTLMPGEPGRRQNPQRPDEVEVQIPMILIGECDHTGALFADDRIGRESNWNYLQTHVLGIPPAGVRPRSQRYWRVTAPSGVEIEFLAQVLVPVMGDLVAGVRSWSLVLRVGDGATGAIEGS